MPVIEPPKFTEGKLSLPGSRSSSSGSSFGSGMRYSTKQVGKLLDQHHKNSLELLDHSFNLQTNYDEGAFRRTMEQQAVTHEQSKDMETHKAGLAANEINLNHKNALEAATQTANITETAAANAHVRNLELHKAIQKASANNTEINIAFPGGGTVGYTREPRKTRTSSPAAETPAAPAQVPGKGWSSTPAGAKTLPITSKSATVAKTEEGPKPLVKKGPGGKFQSLKSPEELAAKKTKKSSKPKVTGPTVKKGPGGKFQSLKG